jgi:hypothetical protein
MMVGAIEIVAKDRGCIEDQPQHRRASAVWSLSSAFIQYNALRLVSDTAAVRRFRGYLPRRIRA